MTVINNFTALEHFGTDVIINIIKCVYMQDAQGSCARFVKFQGYFYRNVVFRFMITFKNKANSSENGKRKTKS